MVVDERGWAFRGKRGDWREVSPAAVLNSLDSFHELTVSGTVPAKQIPAFSNFTQRAIARGTFVTQERLLTLPSPYGIHPLPPMDESLHPGDLTWDVSAVRQRRLVLSAAMPALPSLTAVLVSRRPDLVIPMTRRLASMEYPDLEIVVGLHGAEPPCGLAQAAGSRSISVHKFPGDMVFGQVLQEAFARANGTLVTKIDDDDYYGPHHLTDLVLAHRYSNATLVGKATTIVYLEALGATVRRVFGRWETFTHRVAGGTMLLSRDDLVEVGGWGRVPRGVDTDLLTRVAQAGGRTYYPHDIGYLYVRDAGEDHTWQTDVSHFLRNTRQQWVGLLHDREFGTIEQ